MTSKISYSKYIKKNISERSYLAAVSIIMQIALLPLYTFIRLERMEMYSTVDMMDMIGIHFKGIASGSGSLGFLFFMALFAVIAAITGFSYLHSKEKQDFYIALPVKKSQWYIINYVSGIILFIVPYIVLSLLSVLIGKFYANINGDVVKDTLIQIVLIIVTYLIIYQVTILAMTLTGNLVTAILAGGVISVYGLLFTLINNTLSSTFYETWTYQSSITYDGILSYITPVGLITMMAGNIPAKESLLKTVMAVVFMLGITFALSYVLCKKYPSESAGNSLSYKKTAPVIKAFIAVPVSLGGTLLGSEVLFGHNPSFIVWVVVSVIITLLVCFVIEFIYTHDIKLILKRKGITFLSLAIVIVTLFIYKFDITGYDKWIPKEDKVAALYIQNGDITNYFNYYQMPNGYKDNFTFKGIKNVTSENIKVVTDLAEEGIDCLNNNNYDNSLKYVTIKYVMKNGLTKYRSYSVPTDSLINTYDTLSKNEEFNKSLRPLLGLDANSITDISYRKIPSEPTAFIKDKESIDLLYNTLKEESENISFKEIAMESPVTVIDINFLYEDNMIYNEPAATYSSNITIPVYSSFTKTIELLSEYGFDMETNVDTSKITAINHCYNDKETGYTTVAVTDEKEKEELIKRIAFFGDYTLFYDDMILNNESVEVLFKGEYSHNTFPLIKE